MKNENETVLKTNEGEDRSIFELKFKLAIAKDLIRGIDLDYYKIAWNQNGRKAISDYKKHIGWNRTEMKKY
jgi:hypothetical protein